MSAPNGSGGRDPDRLVDLGSRSWAAVGIIVLVCLVAAGASALSGIIVPLVVAVIIGVVLDPMVLALRARGVAPALAALLALVVSVLALGAVAGVVVAGFLRQLPEISAQLLSGWRQMALWAQSFGLGPSVLEPVRVSLVAMIPQASIGVLGAITGVVRAALALGVGAFFALFFLFFVLRDSHAFPAWVARHWGQDPERVAAVDANVRDALRGYFRGVALTAVITAPIFAIPLLVMRVPLVVPTLVLYFVLSFIPFLGAWITGVFAVLIAFGSGGPTTALIVLLALLVSNGSVQSVVSSWALGSSLRVHPVVVLLATLVGGAVAGILGMVLGAPVVAAVQRSIEAVGGDPAGRDPAGGNPVGGDAIAGQDGVSHPNG